MWLYTVTIGTIIFQKKWNFDFLTWKVKTYFEVPLDFPISWMPSTSRYAADSLENIWEFGVLTLIVDANGDFALRF